MHNNDQLFNKLFDRLVFRQFLFFFDPFIYVTVSHDFGVNLYQLNHLFLYLFFCMKSERRHGWRNI